MHINNDEGNESAGNVDSTITSLAIADGNIDGNIDGNDDDADQEIDNAEETDESDPDPFLVETSKIILDIISLAERTAAEKGQNEPIKL